MYTEEVLILEHCNWVVWVMLQVDKCMTGFLFPDNCGWGASVVLETQAGMDMRMEDLLDFEHRNWMV